MSISIILNGKPVSSSASTIHLLLKDLIIDPQHIVAEVNKEIVPREQFEHFFIKENDEVEILRFVGGG